jgi:hypothetical protein
MGKTYREEVMVFEGEERFVKPRNHSFDAKKGKGCFVSATGSTPKPAIVTNPNPPASTSSGQYSTTSAQYTSRPGQQVVNTGNETPPISTGVTASSPVPYGIGLAPLPGTGTPQNQPSMFSTPIPSTSFGNPPINLPPPVNIPSGVDATTSSTTTTTTAAPSKEAVISSLALPVLPLSAAQGFGAPMGGGGGGGGDEQAPVAEPTFYEKYKYPIWIALAVGAFFIFKKKKS